MTVQAMDEFAAAIESEALKEAIIDRIQAQGPIPFRDFMEMALYHPQLGYYCSHREKMGREGDYLTSPEVSPIFGYLLGRQLRQMWQAMGCPLRFDLVEMGAGSGALACDILAWARRHAPNFGQALSYHIVEVSESLADRQRRRLRALDPTLTAVSWHLALPQGIQGCLLSNELVDSFPVHRLALQAGQLSEVHVGWDGHRFVEELRPPSTPALRDYFRRLNRLPGEGCYAEVNLQAVEWMAAVARALTRGFVLTFDYGCQAQDLYAPWRRDGTLLCFYRHSPSSDPYVRIGRQDMTSHVDFTSLVRVGREQGLELVGIVSQAEFLANLGIAQALRLPPEGPLALEAYMARRRAVTELVDPAGLGRIRVMVQEKGIGPCKLAGLEGDINA